jgi:hypothetical protein
VYQFHGSTAHKQIVKDFKSQLEKWDISMENVPFLVTDTAAAMNLAGIVLQTATEDLIEHVYCLDHVIQLTAKLAFNAKVKGQALETIEESDIGLDDEDEDEGAAGSGVSLMKKVQNLIGFFNWSSQAQAALEKIARSIEEKTSRSTKESIHSCTRCRYKMVVNIGRS